MNKITVIVCSRQQNPNPDLIKNIEETIGFDFQLIFIDNSENNYSIFQAYNKGIEKSSGEILCFLHEDVLLHTKNWGRILKKLFSENKDLGVIGIAGSKLKTRMPSAWWDCPQPYRSVNILQHIKENTKEHWEYGFKNNEEEVVVIDGVFMAARKDAGITFNEDLKGFHNYDLSYCLDYIRRGYKIMVTNRILIEHFSMGSLNRLWYESSLEFHRSYITDLPLRIGGIPEDVASRLEVSNNIIFINGLLDKGMKKQAAIQWFKLIRQKPIAWVNYRLLKSILK